MSIYDAAMRYQADGVPLVVFAGIEYGNGSSRDWAAKGTQPPRHQARLIAQSFERIHRSNLVGMGIAPFTFQDGTSWQTLGLKGDETVAIKGLATIKPRQRVEVEITSADGTKKVVRSALPHRYAGRDRVLPERRHSALRAAQSCCLNLAA